MAVFVTLKLLGGACSFPQPPFASADAPVVDGSTACTDSSMCTTPTAICDVGGTNVCVQCTLAMPEACTGMTPVCGGTSCRGCSSHSECPDSDTCLPDGSCAAKEAVVYLDAAGAGGPGCGAKDAKCGKGTEAIGKVSAAKPYLRVTGTIMDGDMVVDGKGVTILGDATSVLKGTAGKTIIEAKKATGIVKVYDVSIENSTNAPGITVVESATVELYRSKVLGSARQGLLITLGTGKVYQSEISGTVAIDRYGVDLVEGELLVSQSKIAANKGGGISVGNNQKFTITNSMIVENEGQGGVDTKKPGVGSVFSFNTVADNVHANATPSDPGGIACNDAAFTFSGNIIYRNTGGDTGFLQTFGVCKFDGSFLSPNDAAETRILGFVKDTAPRDYHLTAASPATVRDVAGTVCTDQVDYDGESRPQGAACDLGADEYKAP